jgi:hypothetical protein
MLRTAVFRAGARATLQCYSSGGRGIDGDPSPVHPPVRNARGEF